MMGGVQSPPFVFFGLLNLVTCRFDLDERSEMPIVSFLSKGPDSPSSQVPMALSGRYKAWSSIRVPLKAFRSTGPSMPGRRPRL
jgi:hypothetical protein